MKIVAFALLALLPIFSRAQTPSGSEKVINIDNTRECGLITRYSPNKIPANCMQSVQNAYFDKDWSILRREGYAQYNLTACTGGQPIRGLWPFFATDGSQYLVIYSSGAMFSSKGDGLCTEITGLGGLSQTAQMECVQGLGKLWCTNGVDPVFNTTVTTTNTVSGAPLGTHIGFFRNRILIAGVPANLTQLYLSGELDGTDYALNLYPAFSTSPAIIDIAGTNDGLAITCLMGEYQNQYLIGRKYDLHALGGYDNTNFTLRKLSNQIGCADPKSVQEVNNVLMWLSYRGIEGFTGTQISRVSYPIDPSIDAIIAAAGNAQSQTITTQSDFQSGNLVASGPGAPISATISPGNIVPSSWGVVGQSVSALNFVMSDVDTGAISSAFFDNFQDGDYTSNPAWTIENGTFEVLGSSLHVTGANSSSIASARIPQTRSTGTWSFVFQSTQTGASGEFCMSFVYASTASFLVSGAGLVAEDSYRVMVYNPNLAGGSKIGLAKGAGGLASTICTSPPTVGSFGVVAVSNLGDGAFDSSTHTISIQHASNNTVRILLDGVVKISTGLPSLASDSQVSGFGWTTGSGYSPLVTNIYTPNFYDTQVSYSYNTGVSTPVWSQYVAAVSSGSNNPATFRTQSAVAATGPWSALTSQALSTTIVAPNRKFIRHNAQVQPTLTTAAAIGTVSGISMSAETTGYYITPCVTAVGNTAWGNLNVNAVTNGGSFVFSMSTSGISCAQAINPLTANWTTVTANSIIPVAVASYTAVRVLFGMDIATQVPTVNDIVVNWNAGNSRPPVASSHFDDRYWLFYTTNSAVGAVNDHAIIYDQNQKWTLFDDIYAYSAAEYLNQLYTGDSKTTGLIFQQNSGQSDAGGNFTYSFKTADIDDGDPTMAKTFSRAYVFLTAGDVITAGAVLDCNYSINGSSNTYSLGSYTFSESPEQSGYAVAKFPVPAGQPSTFNWMNLSCSYTGNTGPIGVYQVKLVYSPISYP